MKKLLSYLILSSVSLPFLFAPAKADENYFVEGLSGSDSYQIKKSVVTEDSNSITVLNTFDNELGNDLFINIESRWMDNSLQKIFFSEINESTNVKTGRTWIYSISTDTWSVESNNETLTGGTNSVIVGNQYTSVTTYTSNISTNTSKYLN